MYGHGANLVTPATKGFRFVVGMLRALRIDERQQSACKIYTGDRCRPSRDTSRAAAPMSRDEARGRLRPVAEAARSLPGELMENDGEIALVGVSDLVRDLGDRQIGLAKQEPGSLDPPLDHIAMRREPPGLPERVS